MRHTFKYGLLIVLLTILVIGSLAFGSVNLSIGESVNFNNPIPNLRLAQTLTAIFAGSGIALAGLLLQTLFRNPLAGPSVLGVSSGATLGISIGIALFPILGLVSNPLIDLFLGIGGALLVMLVILTASKYIKKGNTLLIIGLMMGYFTSSVVSVITFYTDKGSLQNLVFWGLGSFEKEIDYTIILLYGSVVLCCFIIALFLINKLDLMLLGDRYAHSLGVNVKYIRFLILLIAGILVGLITVWCGPIAFIGIAVPHLARNIFKTAKHSHLIASVLLIGAIIAIACDVIARVPGSDYTLPLNAVTSLFGAPIVIWIVFKHKMI